MAQTSSSANCEELLVQGHANLVRTPPLRHPARCTTSHAHQAHSAAIAVRFTCEARVPILLGFLC